MDLFTATFALVGAVIIIAALLSGLIERSRFPQFAVFILLGAVIGPAGLDFVNVTLDSPIVRVVAVLSLVLVLFTDAVSLNIREVKSHLKLAAIVLGPGTLLTAVVVAILGWKLLGLSLPAAFLLGAALASTDPVMLRAFVRNPNLSSSVRQALRLESGLNDVVLLPIILVCMAFLSAEPPSGQKIVRLGIDLFLLGPGAGVLVGLLSIGVLEFIRKKTGVRRDYESLYSLGVAFLAYALAEAVHGSGFLAAFAAGLVITLLDVELCDCFLEYGETTAEMALLFTFVLFGTSLIWQGFSVLNLQTILFALGVILIRPIVFLFALWGLGLDRRSRLLIAWFGPRGLSSLLMVLLPVFAGVPGSTELFALCCLVILFSILLHGSSLMFLPRPSTRKEAGVEMPGSDLIQQVDEIRDALSNEEITVLDVRADRNYDNSAVTARGAIRIHPNRSAQEVEEKGIPADRWLLAFCA